MSITFKDYQEAREYINRLNLEGKEARIVCYDRGSKGKTYSVELTGKKYTGIKGEDVSSLLSAEDRLSIFKRVHPPETTLEEKLKASRMPKPKGEITKLPQGIGQALERILDRHICDSPYVVLIDEGQGWKPFACAFTPDIAIQYIKEGVKKGVVYDNERDRVIFKTKEL